MEYIQELDEYNGTDPCVVTLGKFDGVHKGHRKLIARVKEIAREHGWRTAVFTFQVSPQVCMGARRPKMLMTNEERKEVLRELDVDLLFECRFTEKIRAMEPEDFVREILLERLHVSAVVMGTDFHFGKDRAGNSEVMKQMGEKYGFVVEVLSKERYQGKEISSSYIREELALGHMEKIAELMGQPYFITGEIVHGRHLGHTLGFPTINQIPDPVKMTPPWGVYYSRTLVAGRWYPGISNIGMKPTVGGTAVGLETYLFDCSLDLYGQTARVELLSFRRPEEKFADIDELKEQMDRDIQAADLYFSKEE
ncbi:MAG: riboflavin biosynthesis protein RibF [Bilifractor sp.]|nr:riboflavin biosynthesis protein RibF [Lachnospiraceae bacterium]MDY2838501.1 riboflavin biosynthesis protein RibF [Bilifractor sp.]